MKSICKFETKPQTIVNGGYIKGYYIIWLNLCVSELLESENSNEHYESVTARLALTDNTLSSFLDKVSSDHLALASNEELASIMNYFGVNEKAEEWVKIRQFQINGYDSSDKVNCFYLNNQSFWLDKATRVGLVNSITAEKNNGRNSTTLWFGDLMLQMPIDSALSKLNELELYAIDCYNTTAQHLAQINKLNSITELQQYDITAGYPNYLNFSIND